MGLGLRGVVVYRTRRDDGCRVDDASISNADVEHSKGSMTTRLERD